MEPWWIYIEREFSDDLMVGPYPTQDVAVLAMNESLLIEGLLTDDEGGIDCYLTHDQPDPTQEGIEQVIIDPADPDHFAGPETATADATAPTPTV